MKKTTRLGFLSAATAIALILAAGTGAAAASGGPRNQIKMFMLNSGVDADAQGKIIFVSNKAQSFFTIQVENMEPNTTFDVIINGAVVDTLTTNASGEGRVMHRARKAGPPLAYDPRSSMVEVALTGTIMLSAQVPATPQEAHALIDIQFDLTPGVSVTGTAHAEYRSRFGRARFDVEVTGAVPGTYDLMVGGAIVGQITVDATGRGEIEFDSRPGVDADGGGELSLLLTFDPRGQAVEVQQTSVAMFSGSFPLL